MLMPSPAAAVTQVSPPAPPPPARRTPWALVALLVVLALVGVLIAFAVTQNDDPDPADPSASGSVTPDPAGEGPTAEAMEEFISTYLETVVDDPEAAFAMLTPGYQDESNGLEGYLGFWGDVDRTELESVEADPESLVVQYTYRYHKKGGGKPVEEDVALQLAYEDGTYLIADDA